MYTRRPQLPTLEGWETLSVKTESLAKVEDFYEHEVTRMTAPLGWMDSNRPDRFTNKVWRLASIAH